MTGINKKCLPVLLLLTLFNMPLIGSPPLFFEYSFLAENDDYMLVHFWSSENAWGANDPFFSEDNNYAYFLIIKKENGEVKIKKKSSFFTYGWIDPVSNYIVLLSGVYTSGAYSHKNLPNIAVFSISGELQFYTTFTSQEYVLSIDEFNELKKEYPQFIIKLINNNNVSSCFDLKTIYITPFLDTEEKNILSNKNIELKTNHISDCFYFAFNQSFVWFNQKLDLLGASGKRRIIAKPEIKLEKSESGKLLGISLLDPCENRFTIPITEKNADGIHVPVRE